MKSQSPLVPNRENGFTIIRSEYSSTIFRKDSLAFILSSSDADLQEGRILKKEYFKNCLPSRSSSRVDSLDATRSLLAVSSTLFPISCFYWRFARKNLRIILCEIGYQNISTSPLDRVNSLEHCLLSIQPAHGRGCFNH